ncbi:MAG TPA: response regulator [Burkholderiaceae bacterium]
MTETPPALSPPTALVVDDNAINRLVACEFLCLLGYRCDVAADGHEALQRMDERGYDLVLMDVQMPLMDGLEATRELRRRESARESSSGRPRQTVIALTASATDADRQRALSAGMDDFIHKPITFERLRAALQRPRGAE